MRKWTDFLLAVLAAIGLAGTLLSLVKTAAWQIRMLDMLREPVMYAAIALALLAILLATRWRVVLAVVFALIACIQAVNLWPYFPLAKTQVALFQADEGECFKVLSLNVEQANDQYDRVARLIDAEQPDLLLLMETDQKWADALQPQLARYPEKVSRPLDNTYGMIFATSLDVTGADIVSDAGLDTPTLYASLTGPAGTPFDFVGLHPRPPLPGEDTQERDRAILRTDHKTAQIARDVVLVGDFNDVPWSRTMAALRERGDFDDPRVGRGTMPSFPADKLWLGWPLDHVLVRNGVGIRSFDILDDVGADHRPMRVVLCLRVPQSEEL